MIIKFKIFENSVNDKKFWIVKNDENLKVRLFKIGMSDETIENIKYNMMNEYAKDRYFYVGFEDKHDWTYCKYNYTSVSNPFIVDGFEFMGHVNITDDDIYNYKIRKEINKYNL